MLQPCGGWWCVICCCGLCDVGPTSHVKKRRWGQEVMELTCMNSDDGMLVTVYMMWHVVVTMCWPGDVELLRCCWCA